MDRRSWPWKKKSSDKTVTEKPTAPVVDSAAASVVANGSQGDQDKTKKAKYVQISEESYSHLTGLEDRVKAYEEQGKRYEEQMEKYKEQAKNYEEQIRTHEEKAKKYVQHMDMYEEQVRLLENETKDLNDKLFASQSEMANKDILVKQHSKVAEDAVSGWEKAEAEALALKSHLESITLSKVTAEDRASHLDGALKECMRQIRNLKDEHEQSLQDVVLTKTKQWEKIKLNLEAKIANFHQELLRYEGENSAISRSLQERSNMLVKVREEKSQAEAEIAVLKSNIESCEREINSMKYEVHVVSKELEIRNEEKNMSVKSAEAANKQHMEGVKKIAKLEAECQRLRGLVRKKLPSPAALAQMKLEVESWGREYGETRSKKSPVNSVRHFSPVAEFSFDKVPNSQKENELLTERLLAMEEETKMLKEALAKRNSELQASRNLCAKTATKLQSLELRMKHHNQQKLYSPTSADGSVIEDGNDDVVSCADSCASTLIPEHLQIKKERDIEKFIRNENANNLGLMDDFLEMEKLARCSNGAVSLSSGSDKKSPDISCDDASSDLLSDKHQAYNKPNSTSLGQVASAVELPHNFVSQVDPSPIQNLRRRISSLLQNLSNDADLVNVLDNIKRVVQQVHDSMHQRTINCESEEKHCSDVAANSQYISEVTGVGANKDFTLPEAAAKTGHSISKDLDYATFKIHEFVMFLEKEAKAVHQKSLDGDCLSRKAANFSVTYNKLLQSDISLVTFVLDLSEVLAKACEFQFGVLGYGGADSETCSADCIDKVALPENKMVKKDPEDGYDHSCAHICNSEVLDDCHIVGGCERNSTSCKFSLEDYHQLKSERDNMKNELAMHNESLQMTRSQLVETEQQLADIKSQLAAVQNSNILAETQLKCMAQSYRSLERRAEELETQLKCTLESRISFERRVEELETEVSLLQLKTESLENELREEKMNHHNALARCKDFEEQIESSVVASTIVRNDNCSICATSSATDAGLKTKQDKELSAAAEKLAECQETIFSLGKQLKALHPSTEFMAESPCSERCLTGDIFEEELTTSCMNLEDFYQAETESDSCSPSDAEPKQLSKSPSNSEPPKHRRTKSGSSSSSLEKHSRGIGRFFSSKGKNSH